MKAAATLLVIPAHHFVIPAKAGIHDDNYALEKNPFVYIMASERNGTAIHGRDQRPG